MTRCLGVIGKTVKEARTSTFCSTSFCLGFYRWSKMKSGQAHPARLNLFGLILLLDGFDISAWSSQKWTLVALNWQASRTKFAGFCAKSTVPFSVTWCRVTSQSGGGLVWQPLGNLQVPQQGPLMPLCVLFLSKGPDIPQEGSNCLWQLKRWNRRLALGEVCL